MAAHRHTSYALDEVLLDRDAPTSNRAADTTDFCTVHNRINNNNSSSNNGAHPSNGDPQPFLKQRRLPSILLDSWEFRKLAAEGSVLANAMVSYDVDDDGVEEVIVGTTEGLLCVVKPDCRAPLFLRVLAATISVVLYTPIRNRLVLITLEGQCEVIDYFLSPNQQQPRHGRTTRTPSCGPESNGESVYGYQRSESTNSLSRGVNHNSNNNTSNHVGSSGDGSARVSPPPPGPTTNPLGPLASTAIPRTRSHMSVTNPLMYEAANQPPTPPTYVFHVPSNCLCADLSTDTGTDLIFLGSYDRRFYVYSIVSGSCLLSLYVHNPITSVRAFTVPAAAARDRRAATSSSAISVYDSAGRSVAKARCSSSDRVRDGGTPLAVTRESGTTNSFTKLHTVRSDLSANASTHTVECCSPGSHTNFYIPLVFLSTPTHLILLPGGLNEIQQWRKLQPKSAHLPLTVQLHPDTPAQPSLQPSASHGTADGVGADNGGVSTSGNAGRGAAAPSTAAGLSRQHSSSGGGAGSFKTRGATTAAALTSSSSHQRRPAPRESETPVPSIPRSNSGRGPNNNVSTGSSQSLSGPQERHPTADTSAGRAGGNSLVSAAVSSSRNRDVGGGNGSNNVAGNTDAGAPLSTSQQRRQARRRAIQAAEMGKPVLVKPLWALHIGKHSLDVPPLQPSPVPCSDTGRAPTKSRAAAVGGSAEAGSASATRRTVVSNVSVNSVRERHGSLSAATSALNTRRSSRQRGVADSRGDSTSLVSVSLPSSASVLRENSDVVLERSSVTQSGGAHEGAAAAAAAAAGGGGSGHSFSRRLNGRGSREGGEETEASAAANHAGNSVTASGLTQERSGSGQAAVTREARQPPRLEQVRAGSVHVSDSTDEASVDQDDNSSQSSDSDDIDMRGASQRSESEAAGEGNAHRRHARRGRSRSRTARRSGHPANLAEEPLEGVRFSLPVDGDAQSLQSGDMRHREGLAQGANDDGESEGVEGSGAHTEGSTGNTSSASASSEEGTVHSSNSSDYDDDDDEPSFSSMAESRSSYNSATEDQRGLCSGRHGGRHQGGGGFRGGGGGAAVTELDPSLLARSLARMRAESVPTMLLRRLVTDPAATATTAVNALGRPHDPRQAHCHAEGNARDNNSTAASSIYPGAHASLLDLVHLNELHRHGHPQHQNHHHRHRGSRCSESAQWKGQVQHPATLDDDDDDGHKRALLLSGNGATVSSFEEDESDVRLPTSVDVSVGASQVAVALSCEDGLAMELRFTVEKLSALSRRARSRTGRPLRLYDLRHPPCPKLLFRPANSRIRPYGVPNSHALTEEDGALLERQRQPASSPSSPKHTCSFPKQGKDVSFHGRTVQRAHRLRRSSGRGGRRPTSLIFLPLPTPATVTNPSTSPSLIQGSGAAAASSAGGGAGMQSSSDYRDTNATGAASPLVAPSPSSGTANLLGASGARRIKVSPPRQPQLQSKRSLRTPSFPTSPLLGDGGGSNSLAEAAQSRRYEEDGVVLRAQCLWAARLGDSPLVQRARVFCVRDGYPDNTFCAVFVAANGTCFAVDGDTLSVVECSVKEDCSSFTLMAGPLSTVPLPLLEAAGVGSATSLGKHLNHCHRSGLASPNAAGAGGGGEVEGGEDADNCSTRAEGGTASPCAGLGVNLSLLRGAVGRTVSCVCVSVDELCIYGVGEANQLVQHRDATQVTPTPTPSAVAEPASLLSRRPLNNPCNAATVAAGRANEGLSAWDGASTGSFPYEPSQRYRGLSSGWAAEVEGDGPAVESEERVLLRSLAQRLKEWGPRMPGTSTGDAAAGASSSADADGEGEAESEEAALLRVQGLLLRGYTDAEWEKLRWLDLGVT